MSARLRSKFSQTFAACEAHYRSPTPSPTRPADSSSPDRTPTDTVRRLSKTLRARASAILRPSGHHAGQTEDGSRDLQEKFFTSRRRKSSAALLRKDDVQEELLEICCSDTQPKHRLSLNLSTSRLHEQFEWCQPSDPEGSDETDDVSELSLAPSDEQQVHHEPVGKPTGSSNLDTARNRFYATMWHPHVTKENDDHPSNECSFVQDMKTDRLAIEDIATEADSDSENDLTLHLQLERTMSSQDNFDLSKNGMSLLIEAINQPPGEVPDNDELAKHMLMTRVLRRAMRRRRLTKSHSKSKRYPQCSTNDEHWADDEDDEGTPPHRGNKGSAASQSAIPGKHANEAAPSRRRSLSGTTVAEHTENEDPKEHLMAKFELLLADEGPVLWSDSSVRGLSRLVKRPSMNAEEWFRALEQTEEGSLLKTTPSKIPRAKQALHERKFQEHPARQPRESPFIGTTWTPIQSRRWE